MAVSNVGDDGDDAGSGGAAFRERECRSGGERGSGCSDDCEGSETDSSASASPASPALSRASSSDELTEEKATRSTAGDEDDIQKPSTKQRRPAQSLRERRRVPLSLRLGGAVLLAMEYYGGLGMWRWRTLRTWWSSMCASAVTAYDLLTHLRDALWDAPRILRNGKNDDGELLRLALTIIFTILLMCVAQVLIVAPFRAGMWTGRRATRHKLHRYMGLLYLTQYAAAWIEFSTNYSNFAQHSVLMHTIGINGLLQGCSAYFSFKVLPALDDAGYYSDKAVLSRNFVHENIFFTLLAVWGTVYYNHEARASLQSTLPGRLVEYLFLFWPYVLIRPIFPITRFSNAGKTLNGRTAENETFYRIGTLLIKFFYMWSKYSGFFMNFAIHFDMLSEKQWRANHGMFLLNLGTISIAVFLHTLRFKRVLPAKLTFSFYILQIYATFGALPSIFELYFLHGKLSMLCIAGFVCNLFRDRRIHACWCAVAMYLLIGRNDIEW